MHLLKIFGDRKEHQICVRAPPSSTSREARYVTIPDDGRSGSRSKSRSKALWQQQETYHVRHYNSKWMPNSSSTNSAKGPRVKSPTGVSTCASTSQCSRAPPIPPSRTRGKHARSKRTRCDPERKQSHDDDDELLHNHEPDIWRPDCPKCVGENHPLNRPPLPVRRYLELSSTHSPSLSLRSSQNTPTKHSQPSKISRQHSGPTASPSSKSGPLINASAWHDQRYVPAASPSSVGTSFVQTPQSSRPSTASTKATSTFSEPEIKCSDRQHLDAHRATLGFVVTSSSGIPNFTKVDAQSQRRKLGCHSFKITDQLYGIIDPKAHDICRRNKTCTYPRSLKLSTILDYEERRDPRFGREAASALLNQLLISDEICQADLPYILACYYWIRRHHRECPIRLSSILRMQCNERQRKIFTQFNMLSAIKDDAELARRLTGVDAYDNPLRLLAFLELSIEYRGPFHLAELLKKISDGRTKSQDQGSKLDHLSKACLGSLLDLVATVVHKVGQCLARGSCKFDEMQAAARGIEKILCFSNEIDIGKVFYGVASKLKGAEVVLCYFLLLATGLGDETQRNEMWSTLIRAMVPSTYPHADRPASAVFAMVNVIYLSQKGAAALFPGLYQELQERRLTPAAVGAWEQLHGRMATWAALVNEAEGYWKNARQEWEERECIYDTEDDI